MTRWKIAAAPRWLLPVFGALALTACPGYADLPVPVREVGGLEVEAIFLSSEGPGRVQVAIDVPADAVGPAWIVGHPASALDEARVVAWATGPCPDEAAPGDARPRLCLALEVQAATLPAEIPLTAVVETRGDGRRFTLVGAVVTR